MVLLGVGILAGYFFLQELESGAGPASAAQFRDLKIPILAFGVGMEVILGYWWIWRKTRVGPTKYKLLKLVATGDMTEKKAAEELGVTPGIIREALKELKKEGVVE